MIGPESVPAETRRWAHLRCGLGSGQRAQDPPTDRWLREMSIMTLFSRDLVFLLKTDSNVLGSIVPDTYVYKGGEGVNPKVNLNNGILFLYINKCSEKSQILVHCCKKLVQFFFIKVFRAQGIR